VQSRRDFLTGAPGLAITSTVPGLALPSVASEVARKTCLTQELSLNGQWLFRLDPDRRGETEHWQRGDSSTSGWKIVTVPHTWQVMPGTEEYRG